MFFLDASMRTFLCVHELGQACGEVLVVDTGDKRGRVAWWRLWRRELKIV